MGKGSRSKGPVAHVARVPLTDEEHSELVAASEFERTTQADLMRRAIREYIGKETGGKKR